LKKSLQMQTFHLLSFVAPVSVFSLSVVCGRNPRVICAGPEPTVDVDRLEGRRLAAFAGKVTLAAGSVDGGDVV
jgi:hypothetical protein